MVATQAQITPITTITVSNLHSTLGSNITHRNLTNTTTAATTTAPPSTIFQVRVAQGYRLKLKSIDVEAPMTFQVYSDLWPTVITNHVPIRHPDLINTFITEVLRPEHGQGSRRDYNYRRQDSICDRHETCIRQT